MATRGFIIHLERAASRRSQAEALLAALPLPSRILHATDGLAMDDRDRRRWFRRHLHAPAYPFELSPTEIACFLSHRRAWQAILDEGCDAGLIIEDDVAPASEDFNAVLSAAVLVIKPEEFIRFPFRDRGESGAVVRALGPARFLEPRMPALNMQMQLVGREAARRLLAASECFDRPVDVFVQMQWLHGARVLSARPIIIAEVGGQLGGSVIHSRHGFVEKLVREVRRPLGRLALRNANEQWRRKAA